MNTEHQYELASPIIFGTAIGTLCTPFGPIATIAGFLVGAGLGFWSDKTDKAAVKSQGKVPVERTENKSICH